MKINLWHIAVSLLTIIIIIIAKIKSGIEILLFDRFYENLGFIQIIIAGIIAPYIYSLLLNRDKYSNIRKKIWLIFGCYFFAQFFLGILFDIFLLNGKLHFPTPFIIEAGAIYRGSLGFMPILFIVTVLLSGGAWCSHLCYFGCFDSLVSSKIEKSNPIKISRKKQWIIRLTSLILISTIAYLLKVANISTTIVTLLVVIAIIIEILIIIIFSRKYGKMVHCTMFCPLGTIVSLLKYINPRRIVFTENCNSCMKCTQICKYGALKKGEVKEKIVSKSCTMCGDCVSKCVKGGITHSIWGFNSETSLKLSIAIISILYTTFLTIAMV